MASRAGATAPTAVAVPSEPEPVAVEAPVRASSLSDDFDSDVPELSAVHCSVSASSENWLVALPVRVGSAAVHYADVLGVEATLALSSQGPSGGARLRVDRDGFSVRGSVRGEDVRLGVREARAIGIVIPKPSAHLRWLESRAGGIRVGLELLGALRLAPGQELAWDDPCERLSLSRANFEPRDAVGVPLTSKAYLDSTQRIRMSTEESGMESLELEATRGDLRVELAERSAARTRILVELDNALLFGWVDRRLLRQTPRGQGLGYGTGSGQLGTRHTRSWRRVCTADTELLAVSSDATHRIGVVRASTELVLHYSTVPEAFESLRNVPRWLRPRPGFTFAVRKADVASCPVLKND